MSDNVAFGLPVLDAEDVTRLDIQGNVTITPPDLEAEHET